MQQHQEQQLQQQLHLCLNKKFNSTLLKKFLWYTALVKIIRRIQNRHAYIINNEIAEGVPAKASDVGDCCWGRAPGWQQN